MSTPINSNQDEMTRLMILASTLQDVPYDAETTAPDATLIGQAMEQVGGAIAGNAYLSEDDKTDFSSMLSGSAATPNLEALTQNADNIELALTAGLMQKFDDMGFKVQWPRVTGEAFQFTLESANKVPVELSLYDVDARASQGILSRMSQVSAILNDPSAGGVTGVRIENQGTGASFTKSSGQIFLSGSSLSPSGFQTASRVDTALEEFKGGDYNDQYFNTAASYTGYITMDDAGQVEASFFLSESPSDMSWAAMGDVDKMSVSDIQDNFISNAGTQIQEHFAKKHGAHEQALNEAATASGVAEMTNCGMAFASNHVELTLDKCNIKVPYDQLTPQVLKQAQKARTDLTGRSGFDGDITMIDENTAQVVLFGTKVFKYDIDSGQLSNGSDMLTSEEEK